MSQVLFEPTVAPPSQRIVSIDALRGFDMFWIIGGEALVRRILSFCGLTAETCLAPQLSHAKWDGFTFYDLIFPLFVFLVGMSTVFSLSKILAQQGTGAAYRRVIRRSLVLFLLGVFYYGGLSNRWPDIRLVGVLQRIALCYLFAGIVFIHFRVRGIVLTLVLLLVGYWALLSFVPVPGLGKISLAPGENWANYVDNICLIGHRLEGTWDPEGLLSTLPAVASCLLGVLAGLLMRNPSVSGRSKVLYLICGGLFLLLLGYAWGGQLVPAIGNALGYQVSEAPAWGYPFPIIKKIWTSSYVLVAAGYSYVLLGVFYTVIDLWRLQRWAVVFIWIGANAITLYMANNMVKFKELAGRLVGGDLQAAVGESVGNLLITAVALGLLMLLARFLYKRKIFLRV